MADQFPDNSLDSGTSSFPAGEAPKLGAIAATNPYDPAFPQSYFVNGYIGRLSIYMPTTVGGAPSTTPTDFPIRSMSFQESVDVGDITTTAGNGCAMVLPGLRKASGDLTFPLDAFAWPNTVGTNSGFVLPIRDGSYVKLVAKPDGQSMVSFVALIGQVSYSFGPSVGPVMITASYQSHGPIVNPTQSLTTAPAPLYS